LVFDNFESVMEVGHPSTSLRTSGQGTEAAYAVKEPTLAGFCAGLLEARGRSLCLFTGRYRWQDFETYVGRGTAIEIHLPRLTPAQAVMLMDNLPRLRHEPRGTKVALLKKVGGHPKSIELLEGWLATGRVSDLLNDPSLDGLLAQLSGKTTSCAPSWDS
jgi:hypothetical protein